MIFLHTTFCYRTHYFILSGDAFLLVFSYNNRDSFEQIGHLRELILKLNRKEPKIVVVGNKGDLLEESPERCAITRELAESLAVLDWEVSTFIRRVEIHFICVQH